MNAASREKTTEKPRVYKLFRDASIVNLNIWIIWTLIIVLPFEPFTILLRILVGGGPAVWFLIAYLLYVIVGYGGFAGLSYFYCFIEEKSEIEINHKFVMTGFYLLFLGVNVTLIILAVAGAIGGYYLNIVHAPVEYVRNILEPVVNPIRMLSLITIIGALISLTPIYKTFGRR